MTNGKAPQITKENRIEGNENEWTVSANGKRIIEYKGTEAEIQIPNYLGGKHITEIVPVTSPQNMVSIFGDKATSITALNIPDGIQTIGPTAFFGCTNIESELYIPESVSYLGFGAFYSCGKMTGSVVIPKGVVQIPPYAFYGCKGLNGELILSDNTNYVGDYAFTYCSGLQGDLLLPDTVAYIGDYAFTYCSNLKGSLSLGCAEYIGIGAFARCGLTGEISLPENLKSIGCGAFEYCSGLTGELILPNGLESIGDAAFNHCSGFTNEVLTIPSTVKVLGGDRRVEENTGYSSHLFYDFGKDCFTVFEVENGNEYFCAEEGVLYDIDKTRLIAYPRGKADETFEIPEGVTQIDELAFSKCLNIKNLVLPDSYVIINEIPENVVNRDGNSLAVALYNYTGVEKVFVKETNPNYISENGILYSKDKKTLWYCPVKYSGEVIIPNGVERIEKGAFYGETAAPPYTLVYIPETVEFIDANTIKVLNKIMTGKIVIDENNGYYTVTDGKIKAVE